MKYAAIFAYCLSTDNANKEKKKHKKEKIQTFNAGK